MNSERRKNRFCRLCGQFCTIIPTARTHYEGIWKTAIFETAVITVPVLGISRLVSLVVFCFTYQALFAESRFGICVERTARKAELKEGQHLFQLCYDPDTIWKGFYGYSLLL